MFYDKILCVEAGHGYITLGYSRNRRQISDMQTFEAAIDDGEITDMAQVTKLIGNYAARHKISFAMITVKTGKSIQRCRQMPHLKEKDLSNLIQENAADIFPVDISDYIVDYRLLRTERAVADVLLCCLPKKISENYARLFSTLSITPLRLDIYGNSVSRRMEKLQKGNSLAVCGTTDGFQFIMVENGRLCDIINKSCVNSDDGRTELRRLISMWQVTINRCYILSREDWIKDTISGTPIEQIEQDNANMALLGVLL